MRCKSLKAILLASIVTIGTITSGCSYLGKSNLTQSAFVDAVEHIGGEQINSTAMSMGMYNLHEYDDGFYFYEDYDICSSWFSIIPGVSYRGYDADEAISYVYVDGYENSGTTEIIMHLRFEDSDEAADFFDGTFEALEVSFDNGGDLELDNYSGPTDEEYSSLKRGKGFYMFNIYDEAQDRYILTACYISGRNVIVIACKGDEDDFDKVSDFCDEMGLSDPNGIDLRVIEVPIREIIRVADEYASYVTDINVDGIVSLLYSTDNNIESGIENLIDTDPDTYGGNYNRICTAIEDSLDYSIDNDSLTYNSSSNSASVSVTYSVVDYQTIYETVVNQNGTIDEFINALEENGASRIELTQSMNLIYMDGGWRVTDNDREQLDEIYQYYWDAFDLDFISADLWNEEIDCYWYSYSDSDEGEAISAGTYLTIETTIEYTGQLLYGNHFNSFPVYYEVYYSASPTRNDAALVYSDTIIPTEYTNGSFYEFQFTNPNGLDEGYYFFSGYMDESYSECFFDVTATVTGDNLVILWQEGVEEYWYSYSGATEHALTEGSYSTSETVMEYTGQVIDNSFSEYPVYYEVYYTTTGGRTTASLIYSDTITPTEHTNGYFYEFQYVDSSGLDAGFYYIVGYIDSAASETLFVGEAEVS